jgi:hypothetical protein
METTMDWISKLIASYAEYASGEDMAKQAQAICDRADAKAKKIEEDMMAAGFSADDVQAAIEAANRHLGLGNPSAT